MKSKDFKKMYVFSFEEKYFLDVKKNMHINTNK